MVWLIIMGVILLLIAAVVQAYCEVSRQAQPKYRPEIFNTRSGWLLQFGWVLLLVAGGILLFFVDWRLGVGAVVVFWLVLPLWLVPAMRRRLLPPWHVVKEELEPQGYTEQNYTSGDWWKNKKDKKKPGKKEASVAKEETKGEGGGAEGDQ